MSDEKEVTQQWNKKQNQNTVDKVRKRRKEFAHKCFTGVTISANPTFAKQPLNSNGSLVNVELCLILKMANGERAPWNCMMYKTIDL